MSTLSLAAAAKPKSERMVVIDILRGFALFGIIINHITTAYLAGPPPPGNPQFNVLSPIDGIFDSASMLLTFGKFFTIFSFLFGLSFAIMLGNAERKGTAFTGRFIWRLAILFVIGYLHHLFYSGDILVVYALLGLLLLPLRHLGNKLLVVLALALVCNVPSLAQDLANLMGPAAAPPKTGGGNPFGAIATQQFQIKQTGSLLDVVRMNAVDGFRMKVIFQVMSGRLWVTLGLFILGLYAGRKKVFAQTDTNKRFFRKTLLWSAIVGVLSLLVAIRYGNPFGGATSYLQLLGNLAFNVHQVALSALYVACITLLYWKAEQQSVLRHLAAVGKIGLSTYLIQSAFGLLLFYGFGFGLMGKIGAAASIGIGIAFFAVQVVFARWWVQRFQYGLVEWCWRALTFMSLPPLRRQKAAAVHPSTPTASVVVKSSTDKQPV